jgi:cytochrome P450
LEFPRDPIACMRRLYRAHGDVAALRDGQQQIVFSFSPRSNQQVLTETDVFHSQFFSIRGPKRSAQRRLTCGLLSMNGDTHRRHRRMVMGPFSKKAIAGYCPALGELTEEMLAQWRPGTTRDIFPDMTRLMLRITSTILFGFDQKELSISIGKKIEKWVEMNHQLGIGALVPSEEFSARYEELLELGEDLEADIRRMIELRRSSADEATDVLSILLRSHDEQGGMTDEELIGQAAILFGAAHLTTANTLAWTLFLLAQHPTILRPLMAEIDQVLDGRPPRLEQLERLGAMERAIKESMRTLPASSYSQRVTTAWTRLGPLELPRGTAVIFSQFITHHREDLYEDPEAFRPDRWLSIKPSPYEYLPFAAGPRMCIGTSLAMMTLKIALPTILQRFRLTVAPDSQISGLVTSTMLTPVTPIPMQIAEQDGRFEAAPVTGNIHELVDLREMPR